MSRIGLVDVDNTSFPNLALGKIARHHKAMGDSGVSRSQQYKMAGNSIVVACMEGIFYNLFSTEKQETLTLF